MKERPILFSAPMVRAILDGRKTQTRRVVKPQPVGAWAAPGRTMCPYGAPGDRLWVRETLKHGSGGWRYAADGSLVFVRPDDTTKFVGWNHHKDSDTCVSIHMPRWASRITLEVVSVRVERLNEISPRDCQLEGLDGEFQGWPIAGLVHEFAALWDSISGKSHPWASNPWVWVVEFKKLEVPHV